MSQSDMSRCFYESLRYTTGVENRKGLDLTEETIPVYFSELRSKEKQKNKKIEIRFEVKSALDSFKNSEMSQEHFPFI